MDFENDITENSVDSPSIPELSSIHSNWFLTSLNILLI